MTDERYSRNEALFGVEGQRRIADTKVAIVGLGGLGPHVAQQVAYLGVTDYRLVDKDLVTESSLNRVVSAQPGDVNVLLKVRAAERMILTIQPYARVELVEDWVEADAGDLAIASADIVFGCVDRDLSRIGLIERCIARGVPFLDLATDTDDRGGFAYGGRVLFSGDRERCPFCMDLLDQDELRADTLTAATREAHDRIYGVKRDALEGTGPSVVSLNGVVASLAVTELMVWRTGLREPNGLLTYRADQGGVRISRDAPFAGCPYCKG
jgi:molybdopterin/thiamine biosynthesis adenylyltransferase